jgi:biotin-(acetyl-CoA carboxylase) ligase
VERLLETYLERLHRALGDIDWAAEIGEKLLYRGERVSFLAGDPARQETLDGVVEGIGPSGELLLRLAEGGGETRRLYSGEIPYPETNSRPS